MFDTSKRAYQFTGNMERQFTLIFPFDHPFFPGLLQLWAQQTGAESALGLETTWYKCREYFRLFNGHSKALTADFWSFCTSVPVKALSAVLRGSDTF